MKKYLSSKQVLDLIEKEQREIALTEAIDHFKKMDPREIVTPNVVIMELRELRGDFNKLEEGDMEI